MLALLGAAACASAQGARIPADAVDAFHAALKKKDNAAALSMFDPGAAVVEFGVADASIDVFAAAHLPFDIDVAAVSNWAIESRRVGGEGDMRWVLTSYHVTGRQKDGSPIDQVTLETMILQRSGGLFRIAHMHWSTNDVKFQELSQSRTARPAGR